MRIPPRRLPSGAAVVVRHQDPIRDCFRDLFRGMRIEDVARLCGVHRRPIEYLVRGHLFRNPREETCEKIAKGLGVSVATVKMALKESVRRRIEWENRVPGVDPGPLP